MRPRLKNKTQAGIPFSINVVTAATIRKIPNHYQEGCAVSLGAHMPNNGLSHV